MSVSRATRLQQGHESRQVEQTTVYGAWVLNLILTWGKPQHVSTQVSYTYGAHLNDGTKTGRQDPCTTAFERKNCPVGRCHSQGGPRRKLPLPHETPRFQGSDPNHRWAVINLGHTWLPNLGHFPFSEPQFLHLQIKRTLFCKVLLSPHGCDGG